jgi:DNA polymerase III alpha subunit
MKIDNLGQVSITETEAFDLLYSGKVLDLSSVFLDNLESIKKFNNSVKLNADAINLLPEATCNVDQQTFDKSNRSKWFMPKEYFDFPLKQWLLQQCTTDQERQRVEEELELFIQHNAYDVLFYLKYLVDTMRNHNIVWGVGRGSSVASYILYLIGIHKIDSIKYNLDVTEFLK